MRARACRVSFALGLTSCVGLPPSPPAQTDGTATEAGTESTGVGMDTAGPVDTGSSGPSTMSTGSSGEAEGSSGSTGEWPSAPFGAPMRIDALSSAGAHDDEPTLTADQLEIYFTSDRGGNPDLYVATRASLEEDWDVPTEASSLNSLEVDGTPELSGDGLLLLFASNRGNGEDDGDIYMSRRSTRKGPWSAPVVVPSLGSPRIDSAPTLTPGLERLYLCSNRTGGLGAADLWVADVTVRDGMLGFVVSSPVEELNTAAQDCDPTVSPDLRTIVFGSTVDTGWDLWTATRDGPGLPFDSPQRIPGFDDPAIDEQDPWLSHEGEVLYFASNRLGVRDLYYAVRER